MPPFKQRIDELPSNGLREDLHAGPVAGIGPGGMDHAVGTRDQLRIVAKETTEGKADARIECSVTHSHLGREGLPTVRRLPDEILHLGVKGVVAIIIPTYVHSAGRRRGPGKEVVLAVVKGVVVHAVNRRFSGESVHDSKIDAGSGLRTPPGNLIGRERTIGSINQDPASGGLRSNISERPVEIVQPVVNESRHGAAGYYPPASRQGGLPHRRYRAGKVIEED